MLVCMIVSVNVCVYEERERISVTLVSTAAQGCVSDLCMCVCACVCWSYFANLSTRKNTHTHPSDESSAKTPGGRADNWLLRKKRYLYRGETES